MEKLISKSVKNRQDHFYGIKNGEPITILGGNPRQWKEIVIHTDSGLKKKNGKPLIISKTKHIPTK